MKDLEKLITDLDIKTAKYLKIKTYNAGVSEAVWSARHLFEQIYVEKKEYLKPSFIYALCSTIETGLNCSIIDFFYSKYGESYKPYASVLIKLTIHDKLRIVMPIISEYKYELNQEKIEIKNIKTLFDIRNQLIHIKNHYKSALFIEMNSGECYIHDLDEKELNIYDRAKYQKLDKNFLKILYRSQKEFTPFFHRICNKMRRKNFNPKDWLISTTIVDNSLTIKGK